jgi:predicted GIY-YIG superfamily endonuclease
MNKYYVYSIVNKQTSEIEYIGESGLSPNLRFNNHLASNGKFAGRRDEVEMKIIESFATKKEAYEYQNKLQKEMGWVSDREKSINNSRDKNNEFFIHGKESRKKRIETRKRLYGIPIMVYKKKNGIFVKQYQCIVDACDELDVDRRNVNKCLNGIRYKSVGGYVFKYKN